MAFVISLNPPQHISTAWKLFSLKGKKLLQLSLLVILVWLNWAVSRSTFWPFHSHKHWTRAAGGESIWGRSRQPFGFLSPSLHYSWELHLRADNPAFSSLSPRSSLMMWQIVRTLTFPEEPHTASLRCWLAAMTRLFLQGSQHMWLPSMWSRIPSVFRPLASHILIFTHVHWTQPQVNYLGSLNVLQTSQI